MTSVVKLGHYAAVLAHEFQRNLLESLKPPARTVRRRSREYARNIVGVHLF